MILPFDASDVLEQKVLNCISAHRNMLHSVKNIFTLILTFFLVTGGGSQQPAPAQGGATGQPGQQGGSHVYFG